MKRGGGDPPQGVLPQAFHGEGLSPLGESLLLDLSARESLSPLGLSLETTQPTCYVALLAASSQSVVQSSLLPPDLRQEASKVGPHAGQNLLLLGIVVGLLLGLLFLFSVAFLLQRQMCENVRSRSTASETVLAFSSVGVFFFYRNPVLSVLLLLCSDSLDLGPL